jgi:cytochrome c oxidase subunit 1
MTDYLHSGTTLKSWLATTDHKRIGLLYLFSILFFFFIGGLAALFIRIELLSPRGMMMSNDTYNRLFTLHGVVMVWFFLIPSIPAVIGNFILPLMLGAKDLAFPRLNLASWYLYVASGLTVLTSLILGGADTGWTFYTPYSSLYSNSFVSLAVIAVFINGFSSIFTGINFIVTTHRLRAPGLTWNRLPLFVWSLYATSLVFILATPVLAITLASIAAERIFGLGLFNPTLGGDPVLFQHLFWFYSHPAVYIMLLPAMGVVSELIACFSHRRVYGYTIVAYSSLAIALYGFFVWGHHMFVSGQSVYASLAFSLLSILVAVPSAIKVFNWTATLYKASVSLDSPMLYALSFIGLFVIGGLTGVILAILSIDVHVHDTYFVVAHFHYIMVGGAVSAFLGGLHYWWPKITGKLYAEIPARWAAILLFVGFNMTFFPQFLLGYAGQPRRYHVYNEAFQFLHVLSTMGAAVLGLGYVMPMIYLTWSAFKGRRAGANPWRATGLEWQTSSPPPTDNFTTPPVVTEEAYAYPILKEASP